MSDDDTKLGQATGGAGTEQGGEGVAGQPGPSGAEKARRRQGDTHAIVTPWPLSQGLRTWCGVYASDGRADREYIAYSPEAVTCEQCKRDMRRALAELMKWVPRLILKEEDDVRTSV